MKGAGSLGDSMMPGGGSLTSTQVSGSTSDDFGA